MKLSDLFEAEETLYHVTLTKHVDKIKKKGILPLQTSNWVQAGSKERYGGGEIFAMTSLKDAKRWALKMDWDHNKAMGTGKISIVTFTDDSSEWKEDKADPISQAMNTGKWLKKDGAVKPEAIKSSEPVTSETAKAAAVSLKKVSEETVHNGEYHTIEHRPTTPSGDKSRTPYLLTLHGNSKKGIKRSEHYFRSLESAKQAGIDHDRLHNT